MEVGPLARMLVGYASGKADFKEVVSEALGRLKLPAPRSSPRWAGPPPAASKPAWPRAG